MMRFPARLRGADKDEKLDYILDRVHSRTNFRPGREYKLNVRREHDKAKLRKLRKTRPWLFGDDGLLKRTEHWENFTPVQRLSLPRRRNASRGQTAIENIHTREDFIEYFLDTFPDLPDGVYGAIRRRGGNDGWCNLFVLKLKNDDVVQWKKKSNGSGNNSSEYYAIPLWIKYRQDFGV